MKIATPTPVGLKPPSKSNKIRKIVFVLVTFIFLGCGKLFQSAAVQSAVAWELIAAATAPRVVLPPLDTLVVHQLPSRRVLFIHEVIPIPSYGSDVRLEKIMVLSQNLGFNVSYLARKDYLASENKQRLLKLLHGQAYIMKGSSKELPAVLESINPTYIISPIWFWGGAPALVEYLPVIKKYANRAKVVAIHDDAHAIRQQMLIDAETDPKEKGYLQRQLRFIKDQLKPIYDRAAMNVFITVDDMNSTQRSIQKGQKFLRPTVLRASLPHKQASVQCLGTPFEKRKGYVFVGNGENPTNYYSIEWFFQEVWPQIRTLDDDAQLFLVGQEPSSGPQCTKRKVHCSWVSNVPRYAKLSNKQLEQEHGIHLLGRIDDLDSVLCKTRCLISPINVGTGVNTKGFLSFTHGLPLVGTSKGLAGLVNIDASTCLRAEDDPENFAAAATELHNNKTAWMASRTKVLDLAEVMNHRDVLRDDMKSLYGRLYAASADSFE